MINYKMLLKRLTIIEGIIFPLFILYACNEPQKPVNYVARVNGSYLSENDLSELIDSQLVSGRSKASIIKNWVRQEVLYQEAVKQGLIDSKDFKNSIENAKRELAAALLLEKFSKTSGPLFDDSNLESYYIENKTSFKLPSNSYYFNRANFSDKEAAVQFRTEVISNGWQQASQIFKQDSSLLNLSSNILLPEQDIYPVKLVRILEGLYPLEISIVITDERGYYTVVQLLDKYDAESIPPFVSIKNEVKKRYIAALTDLAIEDYISDLYSKTEIEIKN
ncbi:MAG: hypothetical protein P8X47_03985 [Ignavibacteriaceae bacterium]